MLEDGLCSPISKTPVVFIQYVKQHWRAIKDVLKEDYIRRHLQNAQHHKTIKTRDDAYTYLDFNNEAMVKPSIFQLEWWHYNHIHLHEQIDQDKHRNILNRLAQDEILAIRPFGFVSSGPIISIGVNAQTISKILYCIEAGKATNEQLNLLDDCQRFNWLKPETVQCCIIRILFGHISYRTRIMEFMKYCWDKIELDKFWWEPVMILVIYKFGRGLRGKFGFEHLATDYWTKVRRYKEYLSYIIWYNALVLFASNIGNMELHHGVEIEFNSYDYEADVYKPEEFGPKCYFNVEGFDEEKINPDPVKQQYNCFQINKLKYPVVQNGPRLQRPMTLPLRSKTISFAAMLFHGSQNGSLPNNLNETDPNVPSTYTEIITGNNWGQPIYNESYYTPYLPQYWYGKRNENRWFKPGRGRGFAGVGVRSNGITHYNIDTIRGRGRGIIGRGRVDNQRGDNGRGRGGNGRGRGYNGRGGNGRGGGNTGDDAHGTDARHSEDEDNIEGSSKIRLSRKSVASVGLTTRSQPLIIDNNNVNDDEKYDDYDDYDEQYYEQFDEQFDEQFHENHDSALLSMDNRSVGGFTEYSVNK